MYRRQPNPLHSNGHSGDTFPSKIFLIQRWFAYLASAQPAIQNCVLSGCVFLPGF